MKSIRTKKTIPQQALWLLVLLVFGLSISPAIASTRTKDTILLIMRKLDKSNEQANNSLEESRRSCAEALTLSQQIQNDTLSIIAALQLGDLYSLKGQNKQALNYYNDALGLSQAIHYAKGICESLLKVGYIHYGWGTYDYALTFFRKGLQIAEQNGLKAQTARALNLVGKYYHTTGDYNQSVYYYNMAAEASQQLDDYDQSVNLYLNIGKTYISKEDIYMTLSYYLKAYELSEKSKNNLLKADVYNHLGSIYLLLEQADKSLEYHRKALSLRKEMNSPEAMATSYNNLGETFLYLARYDSAASALQKSYSLCLQTGYKKGTVKAMTNLGRVNNRTRNLSTASQYLTEALKISEDAGYNAGVVESSLTLAETYLLKKEYRQAIKLFEMSLSKMIPSNLNEFQADAFQGLYQSYLQLDELGQALSYHVKLIDAERKKLLAQSSRQLAELRVSFDLERKENDNQKLRQENELKQLKLTKRNWIIWSVMLILTFTIALCLSIYNRYIQKQKAHRSLQKLIAELELANTEKDKMFSIIAHELRNPLYWFQNLSEMLSRNHSKMSPEKLEKSLLSIDESAKNAFHLMDNLLNWSRARLNRITPKKTTLELSLLVDEILLMFKSIVSQKQIQFRISVPSGALIFADADMFGCVLRNLVSNALKYTPTRGEISVDAQKTEDGFFVITVCDSGIGVEENELRKLFTATNFNSSLGLMQEKGSGLGLKLCNEFTQLNGGKIWAKSKKGKGTCFSFTVPIPEVEAVTRKKQMQEIVVAN